MVASNSHFQCRSDLTRKFLSRCEGPFEIMRKAIWLARASVEELAMCDLAENTIRRSACQPSAGRDLALLGRSYRKKDLGLIKERSV